MSKLRNTQHLPGREACPFLPIPVGPLRPTDVKELRQAGGREAYLGALLCAQSLWLQALPAQALLQINHAFAADVDAECGYVATWPIPYAAMVWVLKSRKPDEFMANPVRHFQHLATRVNGSRRELRSWRAWACYYLSQRELPEEAYPADDQQLIDEGFERPSWGDVLEALDRVGIEGEVDVLTGVTSP